MVGPTFCNKAEKAHKTDQEKKFVKNFGGAFASSRHFSPLHIFFQNYTSYNHVSSIGHLPVKFLSIPTNSFLDHLGSCFVARSSKNGGGGVGEFFFSFSFVP